MKQTGLRAGTLIALLACSWAAPMVGAAHSSVRATIDPQVRSIRQITPEPVRLRDVRGKGLLVDAWVNDRGPFVFAVDTGAGTTLLSSAAADRAALPVTASRRIAIGGLSNTTTISNGQAVIENLALGEPNNRLPSRQRALIVSSLPGGIDGILDPTESYQPLGYVIDIPNRKMSTFNASLRLGNQPAGGTVVRWVRQGGDNRPFVKLGDNRLALIDTGSGFSLAITDPATFSSSENHRTQSVRDLNGGAVGSRRVAPTTISVGSLVLQKIPTDLVFGAPADAPVILGRGALYPFRVTFDTASRLIEIAPSAHQ